MIGQESESGRPESKLVLVVDDDVAVVRLVTHALQAAGLRTTSATDGQTGLIIARKYRPDVALLDVNISDLGGIRLCEEFKAMPVTADMPVIFITGADRTDELVEACFDAGANDLISKPISGAELLGRMRVVLREMKLRQDYRRLAMEDLFTGLANRRQVFQDISEAIKCSIDTRSGCALIIADIDHLMDINKAHGYDLGDELILTMSRLLRRVTGVDNRAGRLGGDQFALVMNNTSQQLAIAAADRIRQTFSAIAFDAATSPKHFSASFGISFVPGGASAIDADEFLRQADVALYCSKQVGRGRMTAYWQLDPNALPEIPPEKRIARNRARTRTQRAHVVLPRSDGAPSAPSHG